MYLSEISYTLNFSFYWWHLVVLFPYSGTYGLLSRTGAFVSEEISFSLNLVFFERFDDWDSSLEFRNFIFDVNIVFGFLLVDIFYDPVIIAVSVLVSFIVSAFLCPSVCLYVCAFLCPSICQCVCLSVCLTECLIVRLWICATISCQPVCLCVYVSINLSLIEMIWIQ